jgi:outer membrane protein TolC
LARQNHPYYSDFQRIEQNKALRIKNNNSQNLPQIYVNGQATYQSDAITISMPDFVNWIPPRPPALKSISADKDQYKVTVDVNQVIYDGGAVSAQKQVSQTTSDIEKWQTETEFQKLKEQVNQIYFGLLVLKENEKLLKVVRETLSQRSKTVQSAVKNGILQQSDIDAISIEILKNQQQITDIASNISSNLLILTELTGKTIDSATILQLPVITAIADSLQRPEIRLFDVQRTSFEVSQNISLAQRKPRLAFFAQAGYGKPGLNMLKNEFAPYGIVGVTLKWNLWDWNKSSHERQILALQRDMVNSKQQAFEKNIRIAQLSSKTRITQLEQALVTDKLIAELRNSITKRSTLKLDQGIITSTDYINDLNAETQAIIQLQTHQIQLVQEQIAYSTLMGN